MTAPSTSYSDRVAPGAMGWCGHGPSLDHGGDTASAPATTAAPCGCRSTPRNRQHETTKKQRDFKEVALAAVRVLNALMGSRAGKERAQTWNPPSTVRSKALA
jgi:hypothetical protein